MCSIDGGQVHWLRRLGSHVADPAVRGDAFGDRGRFHQLYGALVQGVKERFFEGPPLVGLSQAAHRASNRVLKWGVVGWSVGNEGSYGSVWTYSSLGRRAGSRW